MDLKIFFDGLEESLFQDIRHPGCLFYHARLHLAEMPDWKDAHMAVIGVCEGRGALSNAGVVGGPDEIRKKLYRLKKGSLSPKIADLGNLRPGVTLEETYGRIREVCEIVMKHNVLPVILGGSHDLDLGQFMAYEHLEKMVSVLQVDACFDIDEDHPHIEPRSSHTQKLLVYQPNFLFNFSQLGYQTYLNTREEIDLFERLYFDVFRLGVVREKISEMEPVIRNADMLSFDISAIKMADAPGNNHAQPFGLTAEEACQVCWYAGQNDKLSSAGFYEYNPMADERGQTASVIATMVWYFIEGFYQRKGEPDFKSSDYLKYVVSLKGNPAALVFYKNKLNEKWWMEIPVTKKKGKSRKNLVIPCSYEDYQTAGRGELPQRWITAQARLPA